jgi:hypothetical protein
MNLKKEYKAVNWIKLVQDTVHCGHSNGPLGSIKDGDGEFLD